MTVAKIKWDHTYEKHIAFFINDSLMNAIFLRKYWEINIVFTKKIHTAKQMSPSSQWVDNNKGAVMRPLGLLWWLTGKESACNAGDVGSVYGSGRSLGEGNGNPFQHSCLGDPMDRGAWWATVHAFGKE